jgi:hypothetical protein
MIRSLGRRFGHARDLLAREVVFARGVERSDAPPLVRDAAAARAASCLEALQALDELESADPGTDEQRAAAEHDARENGDSVTLFQPLERTPIS